MKCRVILEICSFRMRDLTDSLTSEYLMCFIGWKITLNYNNNCKIWFVRTYTPFSIQISEMMRIEFRRVLQSQKTFNPLLTLKAISDLDSQ
jgi:hypothetical protein